MSHSRIVQDICRFGRPHWRTALKGNRHRRFPNRHRDRNAPAHMPCTCLEMIRCLGRTGCTTSVPRLGEMSLVRTLRTPCYWWCLPSLRSTGHTLPFQPRKMYLRYSANSHQPVGPFQAVIQFQAGTFCPPRMSSTVSMGPRRGRSSQVRTRCSLPASSCLRRRTFLARMSRKLRPRKCSPHRSLGRRRTDLPGTGGKICCLFPRRARPRFLVIPPARSMGRRPESGRTRHRQEAAQRRRPAPRPGALSSEETSKSTGRGKTTRCTVRRWLLEDKRPPLRASLG